MIGIGIGSGRNRGQVMRADAFAQWRSWQDDGVMDFSVPTVAPSWFAPEGAGAAYSIMDFGVATT